jgi:hypothetical protein
MAIPNSSVSITQHHKTLPANLKSASKLSIKTRKLTAFPANGCQELASFVQI